MMGDAETLLDAVERGVEQGLLTEQQARHVILMLQDAGKSEAEMWLHVNQIAIAQRQLQRTFDLLVLLGAALAVGLAIIGYLIM